MPIWREWTLEYGVYVLVVLIALLLGTRLATAQGFEELVPVAAAQDQFREGPDEGWGTPPNFEQSISRTPAVFNVSATKPADAAGMSFQVSNAGTGTLTYTIDTSAYANVDCTPTGPATTPPGPDTIDCTFPGSGDLAAGSYGPWFILILSFDEFVTNAPQTLPVYLEVSASPAAPTIALTPTTLSPSTTQPADATSLQFEVTNTGVGELIVQVDSTAETWMDCTPTTDVPVPATITCAWTGSGALAPATYGPSNIVVSSTSTGITNSPQNVAATLTVNAAGAGPTINVVPSRTSCHAPCLVHFDGSSVSNAGESYPFENITCAWDYGDTSATSGAAATWATSGLPKDEDHGACMGAHVYDTAGSYTMNVTATAPDGTTGVDSVIVTVDAVTDEFAASEITCVSAAGDFTDPVCTGANQITSSDWDASIATAIAAGDRAVLFRRGEAYTVSTAFEPPIQATPGLIGTYDSGARPALTKTGGGEWAFIISNWTFAGFDVTQTGNNGGTFINNISRNAGADPDAPEKAIMEDFLFYDITGTGFSKFIGMNAGVVGDEFAKRGGFVQMDGLPGTNATATYCFVLGNHLSFMGLTCDINKLGEPPEYPWRSTRINHGVVRHNLFTGSGGNRAQFELRGANTYGSYVNACNMEPETDCAEEYVVVANNEFLQTGGDGQLVRICEDQACNRVNDGIPKNHIIFERNEFRMDTGFNPGTFPLQRLVQLEACHTCVFRNNVMDMQDAGAGWANSFVVFHYNQSTAPLEGPIGMNERIWIWNNSMYMPDFTGTVRWAWANDLGRPANAGMQLIGNIAYLPTMTEPEEFELLQAPTAGWITADNLRGPIASPGAGEFNGNPFGTLNNPMAVTDFELGASCSAGTCPIGNGYDWTTDSSSTGNANCTDFVAEDRCAATGWDAGAFVELP